MSRASIYDNSGWQTARRVQVEEERRERELQNAVMEYLPAYAPRDNLRLGVELGEEVIIANVNEWQQKASEAAAQAEEYAQSALVAETRGDMTVASILWGDSWSYDKKAQNYSAEAARYEAMRPNTAPTPVFTAPNTAPKPTITTPGGEKTALSGPAGHLSQRERQETAATPAGTYADREVLELQIANLQSEMQAYTNASGGKSDPQVLIWYANQIHDAMKVMEALPTEPVREDILLQALGGSYYTGKTSLAGAGAQAALGTVGLDLPADIRDISYDIQNWRSVPGWQKAVDFAAVLPVVGAIKPVANAIEAGADAAKTADRAMTAVEAAGDMGKHGGELVDAGGELVYNGARQLDNVELMPDNLMEELAHSGVKYTPEDVLMVTKNSDGDLLWLETGNEKNGWKHIVDKHGEDFQHADGSYYSEDEIQILMKQFLDSEPIYTDVNKNGPYAIYSHNGQNYRIGWGDNGYIKSFFPDEKKYQ